MAKESKKTEQTESSTSVAGQPGQSRLNGWVIAGISAAGALLIAGSAAAGAVVGVAAVSPEPRGGEHQLEQMHERGERNEAGREGGQHQGERGGDHGDREHQGERDGDGFQRQQGPGMPNQQDAPQQQPTPEPQADVTS